MLATLGLERAVIVQPSFYGTDNRCTLDALRAERRTPPSVTVYWSRIPRAFMMRLERSTPHARS